MVVDVVAGVVGSVEPAPPAGEAAAVRDRAGRVAAGGVPRAGAGAAVSCPLRVGDVIGGAHPDRFSGRYGPDTFGGVVVEIGEPDGTRWGREFVEPKDERWWRTVDPVPNGKRWRVTIATRDQGWKDKRPGSMRNRVVLWPLDLDRPE